MNIEGLESHLKRKLPAKKKLEEERERLFQAHEPEPFVKLEVLRLPYGKYEAREPDEWDVVLDVVQKKAPRGVEIVITNKQILAARRKRLAKQEERQKPILERRKRETEIQKTYQAPIHRFCKAIKNRTVYPNALEELIKQWTPEQELACYEEFEKCVPRRAFYPVLSKEDISFGLQWIATRRAQLQATKEEPQSLLRKMISTFRGH
jgi:hypothetical protein